MLPVRICASLFLSAAFCAPSMAGTFTPKSYINAALGASLELKRAEQSFEQAKNAYTSAVLDAVLPSFRAGMDTALYEGTAKNWRLRKDNVNTSLGAAWNLYDSVSGPARKAKKARLDYRYSELSLLMVKQSEALKALNRFYGLFSAQKRVGIAKMNLASREKQYTDTNEQYHSGTRSRIEVTQSEGDKLQSELALAQAEFAGQNALMSFNELIAEEPETPQEVALSTQEVSVPLPFPGGDLGRALENNFPLSRQKINLERIRLAADVETMSNYPEFRVDASWRRSGFGLPGAFGGRGASHAYGVTASLSLPFGFLGAQNYIGVKVQKAVLTSAELDLQNSMRTLKTSVLSAQKNIALQVKARKLLEFQVKAQKEAMDNLQAEYAEGGAGFLQLDNAQTKLLDSSNNQITAMNDLDIALANYRTLLGEKIWE